MATERQDPAGAGAPGRPRELADYPVVIAWPVQWGDQDAFGHVNNTVFARWFESGRIACMERLGMPTSRRDEGVSGILASLNCQYRRQVTYPDTVLIGARITRLGNKSLSMQHVVYSTAEQAVAAEGDSVIVCYDYRSRQTVPIPKALRAAIAALHEEAGVAPPSES